MSSYDEQRRNEAKAEFLKAQTKYAQVIRSASMWGIAFIAVLVLTVGGCAFAKPKYNLYRAGIEKRIKVEEAKAVKDSAIQLKAGEITRAEGVARANEIINDSITPNYLRYFYIQQLSEVEHLGGKIIYVPTEAGLPILEAGRLQEGSNIAP